jgi:hypothetical protein
MRSDATASKSNAAGPAEFRPSLRCRLTAPWRALPDFLVIGAQKAGTTSLYAMLDAHPAIAMSREKECNVLTRQGATRLGYRAYFPLRSDCRARGVRRIGEATPYYLFHPLAPARAAAWLGGVRTIAILRDPVERAWSHYRHSVRLGHEDLPFVEALAREPERIAAGDGDGFRRHSYAGRGQYAPQLARWFEAIGRDRVLVIGFGEFMRSTDAVMPRVASFLEVDDRFARTVPDRNRGSDMGEMPADARALLVERFRRPNEELRALLGAIPPW